MWQILSSLDLGYYPSAPASLYCACVSDMTLTVFGQISNAKWSRQEQIPTDSKLLLLAHCSILTGMLLAASSIFEGCSKCCSCFLDFGLLHNFRGGLVDWQLSCMKQLFPWQPRITSPSVMARLACN